jgi:branched-subunit amino acid transport protein
MTMWFAIGLVGLGSYAFRVIPLLLGERLRLSEKADASLRHAAVGAMTALLVLDVQRASAGPFSADTAAFGVALAISGAVAILGRSLTLVVLCGGLSYCLIQGVAHIVFH